MKNERMKNKIYLTWLESNAYFSLFTPSLFTPFGGLAQLARAPALQAGGQRFESVILHTSQLSSRHNCELCIVNCEFGKAIFDMMGKTKS